MKDNLDDIEEAKQIYAKYWLNISRPWFNLIYLDEEYYEKFHSSEIYPQTANPTLQHQYELFEKLGKEADEIIEATKEAKVKLMVLDCPERNSDIKELLDKGTIGKPYLAHNYLLAIPPFAKPGIVDPGWFADPYKASAGGFIDHAVYQAGVMRWFFNSEAKTVYAQMGKFEFKDWDIEDHGLALVRLKDDSIITLEASNTAPGFSHGRDNRLSGKEERNKL